MPKAAMHKYHLVSGGKDNVRAARKILPVDSEAIAGAVQQRAQRSFRLCVLAADTAHILAASNWVDSAHMLVRRNLRGGSSVFRCGMRSKIAVAIEVNQMVG